MLFVHSQMGDARPGEATGAAQELYALARQPALRRPQGARGRAQAGDDVEDAVRQPGFDVLLTADAESSLTEIASELRRVELLRPCGGSR